MAADILLINNEWVLEHSCATNGSYWRWVPALQLRVQNGLSPLKILQPQDGDGVACYVVWANSVGKPGTGVARDVHNANDMVYFAETDDPQGDGIKYRQTLVKGMYKPVGSGHSARPPYCCILSAAMMHTLSAHADPLRDQPTQDCLGVLNITHPRLTTFTQEDLAWAQTCASLLGSLHASFYAAQARIDHANGNCRQGHPNEILLEIARKPSSNSHPVGSEPKSHDQSTRDVSVPSSRRTAPSSAQVRPKVGLAIITIKPEELQATLVHFKKATPRGRIEAARNYTLCGVADASGSEALVAITRCPGQGNGVSQDVARDVIEDLDPGWLLVVGIAGAMPCNEFTLGDVVLATSVLDFSVEAVKAGGIRSFAVDAPPTHHSVQNYASMVSAYATDLGNWYDLTDCETPIARPPVPFEDPKRYYGKEEWQDDARAAFTWHASQARRVPLVIGMPVASSDRLVKDDEIASIWLQIARHVRVLEMESAGVYRAAAGRGQKRKTYPVMSIRGISDVVGFKRSEEWVHYACHSAASFAFAFVKSGYAQQVPIIAATPSE